MATLSDLQFLVRAARAASLSEAARAAGLSPAAASALLKRVEAELGVRLFVRSTRSLRLADDARQYLDQCERALAMLTAASETLRGEREQLRGKVRLAVPSDLGRQRVLGWLHEFRARHPGVELQLQISDHLAELHREAVDVALRYGKPPDSSLVALPVAPDNRRVLCAAPSYLKARGTPASPLALEGHDCLCFMLAGRTHDRWSFERGGEKQVVKVSGPWRADDGDAVRRLALMGAGIAYKSRLDVADDLARGTLVALCTAWRTEPAPLVLAMADRAQLRPLVRLLRDFLVQRVAATAGGG